MKDHYRAVIIGAGQAGLAGAHELVHRGLTPGDDFLILDSNDGPGGAWRNRWDSLTFDAAHGIADLPGLPLGHPDPEIPASRVVAQYYGNYEQKFGLAVERPAKVIGVCNDDENTELLTVVWMKDGTYTSVTCDVTLNATGTWTHPYIPYIPGIADFRGTQLHTVNFTTADDFAGKKTLVVGGGLSAVQFLLQLAPVTETVWATRRPPNFTNHTFDTRWGRDVEQAVRDRTHAGDEPASVVRTTGIPLWDTYLDGVRDGVLVSRGMFTRITSDGVDFEPPTSASADGLGPSSSDHLVVPESWRPYDAHHHETVDVIFWNTGFRHALEHLAPLKLRTPGGGIKMRDEVRIERDPRIFLLGYGSTASTVGATRAGHRGGRAAMKYLNDHSS